jgi:hypothetical protein
LCELFHSSKSFSSRFEYNEFRLGPYTSVSSQLGEVVYDGWEVRVALRAEACGGVERRYNRIRSSRHLPCCSDPETRDSFLTSKQVLSGSITQSHHPLNGMLFQFLKETGPTTSHRVRGRRSVAWRSTGSGVGEEGVWSCDVVVLEDPVEYPPRDTRERNTKSGLVSPWRFADNRDSICSCSR